MTTTATIPQAEAKTARRLTRKQGLFAPELLKTALVRSFVMLRPDIQRKKPVMFTVEVGAVLSILYTVAKAIHPNDYAPTFLYLVALDVWLFLTVLFANFAEALAEARGKAQAASLRKTRQETPAFRIKNYGQGGFLIRTTGMAFVVNGHNEVEQVASTDLQAGNLILVETGQIIPGDGEII